MNRERNFDLLIIGGGVMGSSIAFHLANDGFKGRIAVFEKDPSYERASTLLSVGGIRRQFSTEVNVRLSQHSLAFYREFGERMEVGGDRPEIDFKPRGYLFLGSEKNWPILVKHQAFQKSLGVETRLLNIDETLQLIPDLNTDDLVGSSFSAGDGYMDPHGVLQGFVRKARDLGVTYLHQEVVEILRKGDRLEGVKTKDGTAFFSNSIVNAAGPYAGEVGKMAGIEIPVVPVRRMVYLLKPPRLFDYDLPLTIDTSSVYFLHETGKQILTGKSRKEEPSGFNYVWDRNYFQEAIWPSLAHRIPLFDKLKVVSGWAGLYEVNQWDSNGIIGEHPEVRGFYVAVGFSGHGFQQAPAVGKALSEWIRLRRYETVDVSPLGYERILEGRKVLEEEVI
ncbi:MAG: FAD-binding oxidoreductase [Candidatus Eisenbacteria bacterium]|nr:FAD-binding oxidoreductase [Candidatus Eisenbacteria bacterium]